MDSNTDVTRRTAHYTVPPVVLRNQDGEAVALQELLSGEQPVMVNFIFTTCTAICPALSAIFQQVQSELGGERDQLHLVSVSIDPEEDTPARLREYARQFDAGDTWHFLTGSLADSIAVQQAFESDRGDKGNHAPVTLFRASVHAPWVRFEGFVPPSVLVQEFRRSRTHGAGMTHEHD